MITIEFNYNQIITTLQANLSDPFQISLNQFSQKTSIPLKSVNFLANGETIKPENKVESYMSNLSKQNGKINLLVVDALTSNKNKNQVNIQSNDIICPECKEPCRFKIEDYHVKLFKCINGHTTDRIRIDDFNKSQEINISSIICGQCKIKNKGDTTNYEFYKCLTCKIDLCLLCKSNHDTNHNIIKYDQKNYICPKHNDYYIKYCEDCSINICFACEKDHDIHKTISLIELSPDIEKAKIRLNEIKNEVEEFIIQIKYIMSKFNSLIKTINIFYDINNNIINNYDIKNRNYELFKNIYEINNNNSIYEKLKYINNTKDINSKINYIIDLYNNIKDTAKKETSKNNKLINDEINIVYNANNQDKINIF